MNPKMIGNHALNERQNRTPTIAIFRMPEPFPVIEAVSTTPKGKIVGNMIELKRPTTRMV